MLVQPQAAGGRHEHVHARCWVHLRLCTVCGHVGRCDRSPERHATAHFRRTGHPVVQSHEPGEDWLWCYADETVLRL